MADESASPSVEVRDYGPDHLLYRVAVPPAAMPPVLLKELEAAWDAARAHSLSANWGAQRSFRFQKSDGQIADFDLTDRDARCWAGAVDDVTNLATLGGVSLCLRLLALVQLLATAPWAKLYLSSKRDGTRIDPALMRAAARADLTDDARFDEVSLRRNLPVRLSDRDGGQTFTGVSA
ncbi:hypothetical protein ACELLULO517_03585 [Acidisoma cellulosilytica]|uniref:Uncharacterized protein n=1 Tax=Acidisoma cellulosilyticum TaxID=2802395 RepID=A0A964E2Y9_9PROT|nr:hypothetical protein [Acidisoma cellulosilyticum]MCB8879303.1 hypothetical protein [Acidisoma cellulosilyticum]